MNIKANNRPKTLGPQAARLVAELHERGRTIFTLVDVEAVTGLAPKSARNFMASLVTRGVATRLKPGLFILVPYELGREREYLGNPYVVARELAADSRYYISHASAMEIHRMTTQPQLVVFTSATRRIRARNILGTEFRFVLCPKTRLFGIVEHWIEKTETIRVSDLERTVIDGLARPECCGGISEVAKGMAMRRGDFDTRKLVDYAVRFKSGAVIRRLGFLLEFFEMMKPNEVGRLQKRLTNAYEVLDPLLPDEGRHLSRWRLRLNVSPEELEAVTRT
ncbi:transcriptional regulator [bacterium]|nr:transcriptional regulator [bacterium]